MSETGCFGFLSDFLLCRKKKVIKNIVESKSIVVSIGKYNINVQISIKI